MMENTQYLTNIYMQVYNTRRLYCVYVCITFSVAIYTSLYYKHLTVKPSYISGSIHKFLFQNNILVRCFEYGRTVDGRRMRDPLFVILSVPKYIFTLCIEKYTNNTVLYFIFIIKTSNIQYPDNGFNIPLQPFRHFCCCQWFHLAPYTFVVISTHTFNTYDGKTIFLRAI